MPNRLTRNTLAVLLAVPLTTGLAACGSDTDSAPGGGRPTATDQPAQTEQASPEGPPFDVSKGDKVDPTEFVETISQARADAKTYTVHTITTVGDARIENTSIMDVTDPANPKSHSVVDEVNSSGELLLVDRVVYMRQLPRPEGGATTAPGADQTTWVAYPLKDMPPDQVAMLEPIYNPQSRDNALAGAISTVTYEGEEDFEGEPVYRYAVEIDDQSLMQGLNSPDGQQRSRPDPTAPPRLQRQEYRLFSNGRVHTTSMDDGRASVRTVLTDYGEPVNLTAPPADQVTTAPTPSSTTP